MMTPLGNGRATLAPIEMSEMSGTALNAQTGNSRQGQRWSADASRPNPAANITSDGLLRKSATGQLLNRQTPQPDMQLPAASGAVVSNVSVYFEGFGFMRGNEAM